ncbi:hypothetical protein CRUP_006402, partial [Coryphaenoides rupestris]
QNRTRHLAQNQDWAWSPDQNRTRHLAQNQDWAWSPDPAMAGPPDPAARRRVMAQPSNMYLSILALFCFKLFIKISLNLLTSLYVVRGNREEAARISARFYQQKTYNSWDDRSPLHDAAAQGRLGVLKTLLLQVSTTPPVTGQYYPSCYRSVPPLLLQVSTTPPVTGQYYPSCYRSVPPLLLQVSTTPPVTGFVEWGRIVQGILGLGAMLQENL